MAGTTTPPAPKKGIETIKPVTPAPKPVEPPKPATPSVPGAATQQKKK